MDEKEIKNFLGKLRQAIHIEYISKYILKRPMEDTMKIINKFINDGIIEESKYAKDYYIVKHIE
jgi:hypothetical protein